MTPCDNCIHAPICNIKDEYRQLLVDIDPFRKRNPAFDIMANCIYFKIGYAKNLREKEDLKSL